MTNIPSLGPVEERRLSTIKAAKDNPRIINAQAVEMVRSGRTR